MEKSKNWAEMLKELVKSNIIPQHGHRILLYGPPGTGKSRWAGTVWPKVERITIHNRQPAEDLLGTTGLLGEAGSTSTFWQDGPAVRAMREGIPLVLDEVDDYSADLLCALLAILDDKGNWGVTLSNGERVTPQEGYCVIGTTNADPNGFPDAFRDRFDLAVVANKPADGAVTDLPKGMRHVVERSYDRQTTALYTPAISVRSMRALWRLSQTSLSMEMAAQLIYGDSASDILSAIAVQEAAN